MFNGRATWAQLAQNWSVSYIGNMIGTFLIVTLMTQGAVFPDMAAGPISMAMPKVGLTFSQVTHHCLPDWYACVGPRKSVRVCVRGALRPKCVLNLSFYLACQTSR